MHCTNCGALLDDGATFCGKCGAKVDVEQPWPQQQGQTQYAQQNNQAQYRPQPEPYVYQPVQPETYYDAAPPAPVKKKSMAPIIIAVILAVIAAAAATCTFIFWDDIPTFFSELTGGGDSDEDEEESGSGGAEKDAADDEKQSDKKTAKAADSAKAAVDLMLNAYPSVSSEDTVTLSGSVYTRENKATLTIDGKKIEEVYKDDGKVNWTYDVQLQDGSNTFELVISDSEGNRDKETVKITFDGGAWPFPKNTELIRTDEWANDRIFVRPGPGKSSGEPIYTINPGDYSFTMTYTGSYESVYDSQKAQYYYWYQVNLPNNSVGWIRADMVDFKKFDDSDKYGTPFRDPSVDVGQ